MNSNRMKYASTPTYGMQKRNFAKKQAAAQATPTPDFTQQPPMDPNTPIAPFPVQSAFSMPQNLFPGASQQPIAPYYMNPQPNAAMMPPANNPSLTGALPPNFGSVQPPMMNGFIPQSSQNAIPPYPNSMVGNVPMGNATPYGTNGQSFYPNGYPQQGTLAPNVIRGDMMGGMNGMPGLNAPLMGAGNNAFSGGTYTTAGFPNGSPNGMPPAYGNGAYQPTMNNVPMGNGGFPRPPFGGADGNIPASPTPLPPIDVDKWLKIILFGLMPLLFIPCLLDTRALDFMRYLFIALSVIGLSVIWYRQAFTPAMRTTLTIAYLVMSIIVIAMLISGDRDVTQQNSALAARNAAQASAEPSVSPEAAPVSAQETPAPVEDVGESEAEQRLATFMDYWQVNRVEDMVNLVQPSWATKQDNAASALFAVISNRTPQEYTIEGISGTSADNSRTVTMSAYIDKNNGKDPVRYRFMILMVKESGDWFVDPLSLATNDVATETPSLAPGKETVLQSLAPRMTVTPIPDPSTKLYYNADGGKYYHADPNCSAVNPKFLPMASFLYSELDNAPFKSLQPCLKCGAPTQSLGSLADEAATPTVAP